MPPRKIPRYSTYMTGDHWGKQTNTEGDITHHTDSDATKAPSQRESMLLELVLMNYQFDAYVVLKIWQKMIVKFNCCRTTDPRATWAHTAETCPLTPWNNIAVKDYMYSAAAGDIRPITTHVKTESYPNITTIPCTYRPLTERRKWRWEHMIHNSTELEHHYVTLLLWHDQPDAAKLAIKQLNGKHQEHMWFDDYCHAETALEHVHGQLCTISPANGATYSLLEFVAYHVAERTTSSIYDHLTDRHLNLVKAQQLLDKTNEHTLQPGNTLKMQLLRLTMENYDERELTQQITKGPAEAAVAITQKILRGEQLHPKAIIEAAMYGSPLVANVLAQETQIHTETMLEILITTITQTNHTTTDDDRIRALKTLLMAKLCHRPAQLINATLQSHLGKRSADIVKEIITHTMPTELDEQI
jgi:hypothetical protein